MSKTRDTGFLNNAIKVDSSGNLTFVSGSTTLFAVSSSGAVTTTGVISGSNALSASYAQTGTSASYAVSSTSSSFAVQAQTASFANTFTVNSTLTAQTLVVQTITSSVDYITGSSRFGSLSSNTHVFTGSILTSGSVGIGTTVASYPLTVNSNTTQTSIGLMSGYSNSGARNWGIATNALAYGDFNLAQSSTSGSDPFSGTSRIYITQAGNVTLTSGAGSTLTLVKTSNNIPALTFTGATYSSAIDGGDYMAFSTSGSYRMYISASGNIGIGMTTPLAKLVVSTATNVDFEIRNGADYGITGVAIDSRDDTRSTRNAMLVYGSPIVLGGGNVGIGTTNPSYNLDIQGSEAKLQLKNNSTGGGTWVMASTYNSWSAGGGKYVITSDGGSAGIKFAIDANGNIGIGTYSPYGGISGTELALHVSNTNVGVLALESTAAAGRKYQIYSSNDGGLYFRDGSTGNQRIAVSPNGHFMVGTVTDYNFWSSWDGSVIRIGQGGAMWHYRDSIIDFMISSNYYIRSSDAQETRMGAGGAANIYMNNGNILLRTGASGAAGSSISWQNALNLTNAGDAVFGYATQQQGLWTAIQTGFTTGNGAFTFDVGVGDEGGGGNIFKVEAGFAHYSGMGYNCLAEFYISTRGTGYEITDVKRYDSANAGSFTAWKSDSSTLRVAKVAGTYGGGGRYWIRVTKVTY